MFDPGGWGIVAMAGIVLVVAKALRISLILIVALVIGGTLLWDWITRAVLGG